MSFWTNAAESTRNVVLEEDFEAAAYRLVTEQILYAADRGSKLAYGLIRDYEREFKRALEPLGIMLKVNSQLRYACAVPQHPKTSSVTVEQTLLALVLRKIFDEETRSSHHDENGEVAIDLVTLEVKYKQVTGGRELSSGGKLKELMLWMRRWGIARIANDESSPHAREEQHGEQPYIVIIRPGIADVLGEAALERLAQFSAPAAESDGTTEAEQLPSDGAPTEEGEA
jgi:hypothetical protein